ncbi:TonB-dependent receptor plug domain-containing protein [Roseateles microcysteis]|uniref:TonB-dependent receptor plug domain-containing protein n=1 Tax=Roseateles microcysteis TaxID=3119057 RepID=UPI003A7F29B1
MNTKPTLLSCAIQLALASAFVAPAAQAQSTDSSSRLRKLDSVTIMGLRKPLAEVAAPVDVLDRDALLEGGATTLGEALNGLPGVHSDTFGAGASRPVIRGQTAPRVKVLTDGVAVLDASDVSPDHAVTVDPLLSERVEVLRGPATLLYGGGAIGGVVNVLDNKVPSFSVIDGEQLSRLLAVPVRRPARGDAGDPDIERTLASLPQRLSALRWNRTVGRYFLEGPGAERDARCLLPTLRLATTRSRRRSRTLRSSAVPMLSPGLSATPQLGCLTPMLSIWILVSGQIEQSRLYAQRRSRHYAVAFLLRHSPDRAPGISQRHQARPSTGSAEREK